MLSVRESFEFLAKGLEFYDISIEAEHFRQLKLKNPKSVKPVLIYISKIIHTFGNISSCEDKITIESIADKLSIKIDDRIPIEINLLLIFCWCILKFQIFEKVEMEQNDIIFQNNSKLFFKTPSSTKENQKKTQFKSEIMRNLHLLQRIKNMKKRICRLEKLKKEKISKIEAIFGVHNFIPDFSKEFNHKLQQRIEFLGLLKKVNSIRFSFYSWSKQIALDFVEETQKKDLKTNLLLQNAHFQELELFFKSANVFRKQIKTVLLLSKNSSTKNEEDLENFPKSEIINFFKIVDQEDSWDYLHFIKFINAIKSLNRSGICPWNERGLNIVRNFQSFLESVEIKIITY